MKKERRKLIKIGIFLLIAVVIFIVSGLNESNFSYNLGKRIPKIIAMCLTGFSIGVSTVLFQTISSNKILTPSILGLDSLYGCIQTTIVFILGIESWFFLNKNLNFLISTAFMVIMSLLLFKVMFKENKNIHRILLVGIVLGTLFKSITTFMQVLIDPNEFDALANKLFASFGNINNNILILAIIIIILIVPFIYDDFKKLDVILLGRDNAINLGVEYEKLSKKTLIIVSILTSISTALVGPITFLGLITANVAYKVMATYKHIYIVIASGLLGALSLVIGEFIVERILNYGSTVSVIINFIGGIYFIVILMKGKER